MIFDFRPPSSSAAIEWALAYASAGMAVFPLSADNTPAISKAQGGRGVYDATTDADRVCEFWAMFPHAEIGWGVPASVVVVDLDEKKGKHGRADFFKRAGFPADSVETPIAVTPSGAGLHLVLDACGRAFGNKVGISGTGIDFRTAGGYIMLPRKGNGRRWLKPLSTPLAPAPAWLPTKAPERPAGDAKPFTGKATPAAIEALERACEDIRSALPGSRNATINGASYSIGRRIGAGQLDEGLAHAALVHAVESMAHAGANLERDIGKVDCAIAAGKARPREERGREGVTFAGVLDIAGQIAKAAPHTRDCVTRWGASLMAENVRAGKIRADLAQQVLFEAARRNGLSREQATAIIEAEFHG